MRDQNKMHHIMVELERIWSANPELSLGQLLSNATDHDDKRLQTVRDQELIDTMYRRLYTNLMEQYNETHKKL